MGRYYSEDIKCVINILLHDWEGNMVRGWQYWPDRREGQYIAREPHIARPKEVQYYMTLSCAHVQRGKKAKKIVHGAGLEPPPPLRSSCTRV